MAQASASRTCTTGLWLTCRRASRKVSAAAEGEEKEGGRRKNRKKEQVSISFSARAERGYEAEAPLTSSILGRMETAFFKTRMAFSAPFVVLARTRPVSTSARVSFGFASRTSRAVCSAAFSLLSSSCASTRPR
eukprot:scaffold4461_cov263-Pinguiococcus_pyrenoidosus.AAC.4